MTTTPFTVAEFRQRIELQLTGETFALVGEQDRAPVCDYCGRRALLIAGKCEACRLQEEIDQRAAEARQRDFFTLEQ